MLTTNPLLFLFFLLPGTLAGYALLRGAPRRLFLLAVSLVLYVRESFDHPLVLPGYVLANYELGFLAARHRATGWGRPVVLAALAVNLLPLAWFKYTGFLAGALNPLLQAVGASPLGTAPGRLPLGISFFAFVAIAYVLDVHRGEAEPERSLPRFALFLSFFPKLAAGPITRYGELRDALSGRELRLADFAAGVRRFAVGLGKKVLIADALAATTDQVFSLSRTDLTTSVAWFGLACYTLQLYFDFSGYTDMAIGLGRMFGFTLPENFDYPYVSRSLTDFWRRWHISLSSWLRDYVFIPLSYALLTERIRKKIARREYRRNYRSALAIVVVFGICGLWHGVGYGFVAWGVLNGAVLAVEALWLGKKLARWSAPLQHVYLLAVVMLAWVLFRAPSLTSAFHYYGAMLGASAASDGRQHLGMYVTAELWLVLGVAVVASTPVARWASRVLDTPALRGFAAVAETALVSAILVVSFASLAGSTYAPAIYQRF